MKTYLRTFLGAAALLAITATLASTADHATLSPGWARALPSGPDVRVKITHEYARQVGRDSFFWAWPLVNMLNRRLAFAPVEQFKYVGPLPQAPLNRLTMLTDYLAANQRNTACPNQDVVYRIGALALDVSPVVIQVPDFGDRFWVYQIVDLRTVALPSLDRCTAAHLASIFLRDQTGMARCPKELQKSFGQPPIAASLDPELLWMTQRRTERQSSRFCSKC